MNSPRASTSLSPRLLASLVLLPGLLLSVIAGRHYAAAQRDLAQYSLQRSADRFDLILENRLEACGNLVRAIQLVLAANPQMSPEDFEQRVAALRAERSFPSLQAVAYARRLVEADGSERYRTTLVAPRQGNEMLWGLDVTAQPENLRVLKQALALDEPRISAPFKLIQASASAALPDGVVIRLPLLQSGLPAQTAEQRIALELGSIAVSFRLGRLIDAALQTLDRPADFELQLRAPDQDGGGLIYSSADSGLSPRGQTDLPGASANIDFGGRRWQLVLLPAPSWYAGAEREAQLMQAIGAMSTLFLAAFVWAMGRTRRRAEVLARRMSQQAEQSLLRFRRLSDLLPVAALLARRSDGQIEYSNRAGRELFALDERATVALSELGIALQPRAEAVELDSPYQLRSLSGRRFPADLNEVAIEEDGQDLRLLVVEDITERTQLTAQLRHQASHDALTGLCNRREFDRRLQLAASGRDGVLSGGALLYLDLDQFKVINDTCGHSAGDQLLARLAVVLKDQVNRHDLVARLGGDEFGILATTHSVAEIRALAERLRQAVEAMSFVWDGRNFALTVSIGAVALGGSEGLPDSELLSIADTACYLAKEAGRNRFVLHDDDAGASIRRRSEMDWVQRIRHALLDGRFCLYYQELQPLSADANERGAHFELLVRMRDERGELVPPGAFIPAAERYGVMPSVDRWVVATALRHFDQLHPQGSDIGLCAINLSGPTMGDETFPAFLLQQLRDSKVPADRLCFEITETSAVANFAQAVALIDELRALGCKVALDDFGAGMSSFGYLKNLPVDFIKIDGSFIRELETDAMSQSIVRAITEIGHQFRTRVVAEFVGQASTRNLLATIGVDYAQGFGIHVPQVSPLFQLQSTPG